MMPLALDPVLAYTSLSMSTLHIIDAAGQRHAVSIPSSAAGQTVARCVYTSGLVPAPALCSGLGRCGACRMRFLSEVPLPKGDDALYFSQTELERGWRLACRHAPRNGMIVELPGAQDAAMSAEHISPAPFPPSGTGLHAPGRLTVAVDMGTTSLHWSALMDGTRLFSGQMGNPQMGAGSEVMSRLAFARERDGALTLQRLMQNGLRDIVAEVSARAEAPVQELCIAGNTVMTCLLLGKNTAGLAAAPYSLSYRGGTVETLPGLPPCYIPPLPAPFVGADLSAGILAVENDRPAFPYLLADMGTNGEFVLAPDADHALVTSVALGPALEGIGLHFGTVASPGAVSRFTLSPAGLIPHRISGNEPESGSPRYGITGTGYLSLIHALLRCGILDADGHFTSTPSSPLGARLNAFLVEFGGEQRFMLPLTPPSVHGQAALSSSFSSLQFPEGTPYLSAADVEEILKVKAAFALACERLLREADLSPADLRAVHLAGALGTHVQPDDLAALGFFPDSMEPRIQAAGNTSLRGAELFLIDPTQRAVAERRTAAATPVDLTTDAAFTQTFVRHMHFAHL